jgi:DNA-binding CsgD family transcriptional regulator
MWSLPELVEAGARTGDLDLARDALNRLVETTRPAATDYGLGVEARSRALLADDGEVEALHREAIDRLSRTQVRSELARAHLLYGEWLRHEGLREAAREHLRTAHELFTAMEMAAFGERARRELSATGETVRRRTGRSADVLTPQERQIATLAGSGLTNAEIGGRLFVSPRTVEWHLKNVYRKLEISSRRHLQDALEA